MEIFIEENFASQTTKFWIRKKESHPHVYIGMDKGQLTEYTINNIAMIESDMKPFLELPYSLAQEFIKLIANYASGKNIKTEQRSFIEGELLATKKHLETMEQINFKLLKITPNP